MAGAWGSIGFNAASERQDCCAGRDRSPRHLAAQRLPFDPLTNAFAAIGERIWPRSGATATELQDGRVLLFGGGADGRYPDRAEIIDPTTRNISALTSIGSGRVFHTATPLPDGRVLIAGGLGYSTSGTSTAEAQPFLFVP